MKGLSYGMSDAFFDIRVSPGAAYALSQGAVRSVLASKNPDCAMLLLYIVHNNGRIDPDTASAELSIPRERVSSALSTLISDRIIIPSSVSEVSAPTNPRLMSDSVPLEDIEQAMAEDTGFSSVYKSCEEALGHPLRHYEASTLMNVYTKLNLPGDVLLLLIGYKADEASRKSNSPRLSVRAIAAEACKWSDAGITTLEAADDHVKQLIASKSLEGQLRRLFGIRDRRPSPTELSYIRDFIAMGFEYGAIERAYDITVTNKGSLIWPYMNSILKRWQREGKLKASDHDRKAPVSSGDVENNHEYFERARRFIRKEGD